MSNYFAISSVEAVDYHRNGVGGVGFGVGIFKTEDGRRFLAIRAPDNDGIACYAVDLDSAASGNIAFGDNSWRGDVLADEIYRFLSRNPPATNADGTPFAPFMWKFPNKK